RAKSAPIATPPTHPEPHGISNHKAKYKEQGKRGPGGPPANRAGEPSRPSNRAGRRSAPEGSLLGRATRAATRRSLAVLPVPPAPAPVPSRGRSARSHRATNDGGSPPVAPDPTFRFARRMGKGLMAQLRRQPGFLDA